MFSFLKNLLQKCNGTDKFKFEATVVKNDIKVPTKESIINIHNNIIELFPNPDGGKHFGERDHATIEHMINVMSYDYELKFTDNKKDDIILRGAHMLNYLACGHCFVEGNKRTAFVMLLLYLLINDITINYDLMEYKANRRFVMKIAKRSTTDKRNVRDIEKWIKSKIV